MKWLLSAAFAAWLPLATQVAAQEIQLARVTAGIDGPTDIENAGDGSGRLFLVQQNGLVRILQNGNLLARPFLDIRSKTTGEGERGLLGLAFAPQYAANGRFYVDYTDLDGNTVIAQYRVSSDPNVADPNSEIVLLHINQPFENHNGGQVRFGPDGYLYIAMGDGGSGGDPMNNGQSLNTLLAKLLRIDVESSPGSVRIPPDNPFVGTAGARPEIWAYGLRNPWRFSFDRATRDLWIGDVGQENVEEIDFQPASSHGGENYGWNLMEGLYCYLDDCDPRGLTLPVAEYTHDLGCAVIGGTVYRGVASPALRGTYLYGDLCNGTIWGLERQSSGWSVRVMASAGFSITAFGEDEAGELYISNFNAGAIEHIVGGFAPRITASGVVNSASFVPGISPGSLATVFAAGVLDSPGVLSASQIPVGAALGGVSVTVAGIPAPVLSVANVNGREQVNFQAPFEIAGRESAPVVVSRSGRPGAALDVPVLDVQPAVYTSDGAEAILVHVQDNSLVTASRPLRPGEFATLYASGVGRVSGQPETGAAAPASPPATAQTNVQVTVGGIPCEVQYAGLAPGLVGVYQVNFRVAPNAPVGSDDVIVTAGGVPSPAVKTTVQ